MPPPALSYPPAGRPAIPSPALFSTLLADGSEVTLDVYAVTVLWDDQPRDVVAYVSDTTPLVGMSLLESHSLYVEVEDGGRVIIEPRPTG